MTARRCAEVTLQHGYRYFVGTAASDASSNYSFTTPGYASTYGHGSAVGYGNYASGSFSSNTIITPPQTYNVHKPALTIAIKMSNNEKSLEPYGMVMAGVKARPSDAAFLIQSLPKSRQIAPAVENRRARMAPGRSLSALVPGSNKMLHPLKRISRKAGYCCEARSCNSNGLKKTDEK